MSFLSYALVGVNLFFIGLVSYCVDEARKRDYLISSRMDGLHERMDTLRDFMLQRFENDIQYIKDKLNKEIK